MGIEFYRDENGYVGEAPRLSDVAEEVQDTARSVSSRLSDMLREVEALIDIADAAHDAVDADPAGYRRGHIAAWRAVTKQLDATEAALATLGKMLRAA